MRFRALAQGGSASQMTSEFFARPPNQSGEMFLALQVSGPRPWLRNNLLAFDLHLQHIAIDWTSLLWRAIQSHCVVCLGLVGVLWAIFLNPCATAPFVRPLRSPVLTGRAIVRSYRPPMPCGHCAVQTLWSAGPVGVAVFCPFFLPAHAEALRSPTVDHMTCECHIVQFSS